MKYIIFGGTFNPVHTGHINIAVEALSVLEYDRVIFVPTNKPSHKRMGATIDAMHRVRMVELAVSGYPQLLVDRCDVERGGVSYSIDTVQSISRRYRMEGKPGFLIGDDLLEGFPSWREVDTLIRMIDLVVAHRRFEKQVRFEYPHRYLDNSPERVSSEEIRERIRNGEEIAGLVPDSVRRYIEERGLYRHDAD